jgi:hypothetical protein
MALVAVAIGVAGFVHGLVSTATRKGPLILAAGARGVALVALRRRGVAGPEVQAAESFLRATSYSP